MSIAYMITSGVVTLTLLTLILIYCMRWRNESPKILQVLMILLLNQVLESGCEMMSYIKDMGTTVCTISIIGRVAFTVAANFWIIFITRLIYREKLAPGKYFNLLNFMFKNIILAYIPSLIISAFLFLILSLTQTINEQNCWNNIANKETLDYVIYGICFILPNLVSCIIIVVYLWLYFKLPETKWTIYLLFPLIAIFFSLYYVILKSYVFFWEKDRQTDLEIPLIMEPFLYGTLFVYIYCRIYCRQQKKDMTDSDLTIPDSDVTVSFIDQM